jgi:hypothetical protein
MKKTNKSNPLKTFNDNKVLAYKKAGGAMKEFRKSLLKAQDGISMPRPLTQEQAAQEAFSSSQNNPMYSSPVPFASEDISTPLIPSRRSIASMAARTSFDKAMSDSVKKQGFNPEQVKEKYGTGKSSSMSEGDFNKLKYSGPYKKGGSVKRKK